MNAYELTLHLHPLFVLHYWKDEKEKGEYVGVILGSCGWMLSDRFGRVVTEIVKEWKATVLPKPPHFIMKYHQLAEKHSWAAPTILCRACVGGSGFVYVWVRNNVTGEELRAMKPCPQCRHGSDVPLKDELVEIPAPESQAGLDWAKVTPRAARWMLTVIEGAPKRNIPAEWVERLVTLSAQPDPEGSKPPMEVIPTPNSRTNPMKVNEYQRKNELVRALAAVPEVLTEDDVPPEE